jgi:hypothetical protein
MVISYRVGRPYAHLDAAQQLRGGGAAVVAVPRRVVAAPHRRASCVVSCPEHVEDLALLD